MTGENIEVAGADARRLRRRRRRQGADRRRLRAAAIRQPAGRQSRRPSLKPTRCRPRPRSAIDAATTHRRLGHGRRRRRQGGGVVGRPTTFAGTILARGGDSRRQRRLRRGVGQADADLHRHGRSRARRTARSARCCSIRDVTIASITPGPARRHRSRRPPRTWHCRVYQAATS